MDKFSGNPPPYYIDHQQGSAASVPLQASSQQQQVIVVAPAQMQTAPLIQSFVSHIILACITFWCCGWLFGLIAFILAVMAQNRSTSPNPADREAATSLGKASIGVSIAGIIIGTILIIIIIALQVAAAATGSADIHN